MKLDNIRLIYLCLASQINSIHLYFAWIIFEDMLLGLEVILQTWFKSSTWLKLVQSLKPIPLKLFSLCRFSHENYGDVYRRKESIDP